MTAPRRLNGSLDEHLAAFARGAEDLIEERELRRRLEGALERDEPLRVKFGMDPSSPDLHLGHAIPLMKLRDLQLLGHQVVLIVGDATAMVGDPSGRSKLRPVLTREQVEANLETYTAQAGLVLDLERTEVVRNASWFDGMGFEGLLDLTTRMTVAQMVERDTFQKRLSAGEPVGINEFLYPLMQGWDSVQVRSDAELGGTDQLFNLLVGRRLQEQEGQRPQVVVTTPLVNGLDGRKMSKSYGNAVGLTDSAREMTFGLMRLDDEAMRTWFVQLTRVPLEDVEALLAGHPREAKARLAHEVTAFFHGADEAQAAAAAFDREVRDRQLPEDLPEWAWGAPLEGEAALPNVLHAMGLVQSTSEARRAIQQGGVRLDGEVQSDPRVLLAAPAAPVLIQVGKKRAARLLPPQG
ncbi:MAG: tyrosine--tRNA ligase [Planctomycetes bacterium]|nr:tyrosine--tRNA ligase [Planctomycetota bacterium]MDA0948981.1 tyrosine--tRNA ligase [Planctomycetota bacterium]